MYHQISCQLSNAHFIIEVEIVVSLISNTNKQNFSYYLSLLLVGIF